MAASTAAYSGESNTFAFTKNRNSILTDIREKLKIHGILSNKDGSMSLQLTDGRRVSAENVSFSSSGQAFLYKTLEDMNVNPFAANGMIVSYYADGGSVSEMEYALGIKEAYISGKSGLPINYSASSKFSSQLMPHQSTIAYRWGITDGKFSGVEKW